MTDKFNNKYRIASARLPHYDYASNGSYFITICTANHEHWFGDIINGKMMLNDLGELARDEWIKTPILRTDMNLNLDEFVIMPNHIHAILYIGSNQFNKNESIHTNHFAPQTKNLASIIRGYKASVTTHARKKELYSFKWQSRYHEHVIRSSNVYNLMSNYIATNPLRWTKDIYNVKYTI